jgi:hypothetical protein
MHDYTDQIVDLLGASQASCSHSWEPVEAAIGTTIPADYKKLVDKTGAILIDGWLCIFEPDSGKRHADLGVLVREREQAWQRFREFNVELPSAYFETGHRLIAFGAVEANYFLWHVRPGVPADDWGVVIVDADLEDWYEFEMSATECIYKILVGQIELEPFEGLFLGPEHSFAKL